MLSTSCGYGKLNWEKNNLDEKKINIGISFSFWFKFAFGKYNTDRLENCWHLQAKINVF